jgi:hypothetical protein
VAELFDAAQAVAKLAGGRRGLRGRGHERQLRFQARGTRLLH